MTTTELFSDLKYYWMQLIEGGAWKGIIAAVIVMFNFIFPETMQQESLLIVLILITLDSITGIWAAIKNKDKIQSKVFKKSISKIFLYIIILIAATLVDRVMVLPLGITIAYFVNAYMALNEFGSILENLEKLGVGTPMKLIRILKGKIGDKIKDLEDKSI